MGLPRALQEHQKGNTKEAKAQYERALEQGEKSPILYQNLGALLRKDGEEGRARIIYDLGLRISPNHLGLRQNRANLLYSDCPASSIQDLIISLRIRLSSGDFSGETCENFRNLIAILRDMGCMSWAFSFAQLSLNVLGIQPIILAQVLVMLDEISDSKLHPVGFDINEIEAILEHRLNQCEPFQQAELRIALANHDMSRGALSRALKRFDQSLSVLKDSPCSESSEILRRQKLVDVSSWNFGCGLLKFQQLAKGWKLYEYGLRTPAPGRQRWQRALQKPFAFSELMIWRGESLSGKRILLLEEQAIGDVMMFISLVPVLQQEAVFVGLLVSARLKKIYKRVFGDSLGVYTMEDAKKGRLNPEDFDFQSPLGSICQHRFSDVSHYSPVSPILSADLSRSSNLRQEYLALGGRKVERLVGVSWKGGGLPGRIRQKSIQPEQFTKLMQPLPGTRFVSLQYGKVESQMIKWRDQGIDIIHDHRVDALRDMNLWLDQVAACDAVVSVANTTIHGAGGLNLPTICLLSTKSDWRWFEDPNVTRSYWYPSVGIEREHSSLGWSFALDRARNWIESNSPMPDGPISS